jgi:heat shock protein HslJ
MVDAQVLFVTMRYSGGLFSSDKIYPVPISAFSWDAAKEELQLDLEEETLQDAPGFDENWPDPSDPNYDQAVYDYWVGVFPELPQPAVTEAAKLAGAVAKVSNMIGLAVMNPKEESLGEIEDIIINIELQLLNSVVLEFQEYTGVGTAQYVLPLAAFELDLSRVDEDNPLVTPLLNMSPNNLRNGPTFSGYVDLSDPNWSEPYQSWWERMQRYTEQVVTPLTLAGTAWELQSFGEPEDLLPAMPGTRLTLNFMVEKYAGFGGCDWYLGVYAAQADHMLRFQTPAQTRVGCTVDIATQQGTFITSLLNVTEYDLLDGKLIAYTVMNQRLLTFVPAQPVPFETTTWALKILRSETRWYPTILGTEITARFEGNQVSGSAGCNTYTATFERTDDKLTISDLTVTEMACTEPEGIMDQEEVYLSLLQTTDSMVQLDGMLPLADVQGEPILLFGAKDVEGP